MDVLTLLRDAREAGLTVSTDGELLTVRGPKRLNLLALELLVIKPDIIAILDAKYPSTPDGWTRSSWRDRLHQMADRCESVVPDRAQWLRQRAEGMKPEDNGSLSL